MRRPSKNEFSPIEFIEAWQESNSTEEVCAKLKISSSKRNKLRMGGRAAAYRKKGVPLKKFPRGTFAPRASYDWKYLSFHAQKVLDQSNEEGTPEDDGEET
jgi:hypothetical protein|tara:strand:- start:494 stop:796 length:303 start_codon:yes stop_codon:yes gene_type:complete